MFSPLASPGVYPALYAHELLRGGPGSSLYRTSPEALLLIRGKVRDDWGEGIRIALSVNDEDLDPRWGKVHDVVVTKVDHGEILSWELREVGWDCLRDEGPHGAHHAGIVRFLIANKVDTVVIDHAGQSMLNTMAKMRFRVITGQTGSIHQAALRAAAPQP